MSKEQATEALFIAGGLAVVGWYFLKNSKKTVTKPLPVTTSTGGNTSTGSKSGSGTGSKTPKPSGGSGGTTTPHFPNPHVLPKFTLQTCADTQLGSRSGPGGDVAFLQAALGYLGYNLGPTGVDGQFGPYTQGAVRAFQRAMGISVDGIAGPQTYGALNYKLQTKGGYFRCPAGQEENYTGPVSSSSGSSGGASFPHVSEVPKIHANTCSQIQLGSRSGPGGDVALVQWALGYMGYNLGPTGIDGIFGPYTQRAVRSFQSNNHIQVDGIVGPQTYGTLNAVLKSRGGYFTCG